MPAHLFSLVRILSLLLLVSLAAISDVRDRKIPNALTLPFALAGLLLNMMSDFPQGLITGLLALLLGFGIFILPYIGGVMGAGDVKLMAAIGALSNWRFVLAVLVLTAISGGLITVVSKLIKGGLWRTLKRMGHLLLFYLFSLITVIAPIPVVVRQREKHRIDTSDKEEDYIPYGLAIAAGTIVSIILILAGVIEGISI